MTKVGLARKVLSEMGKDWRGEIPIRLHQTAHGTHYGLGSSPPFAPEFNNYIGFLECSRPGCRQCRDAKQGRVYMDGDGYRDPNQDHRTRTNRAFRKLRRVAPLEFDVLYLAVMHGLTLEQIMFRLNDRATTKGYPERYGLDDIAILALCGIDKVAQWY